MAQTPSTMLPLGTPIPQARLPNVLTQEIVDFQALARGKRGLLVMFICNHCPYVVHIRAQLVAVAHEAQRRGFAVVAVNSNSEVSHPQDGPTHMAALAKAENWGFPFVFDATQEVAKRFQAACTPDLYLFDAQGTLAYRGRFDESTPGNGKPVTGADFKAALDAVAAGQSPSTTQLASLGCNIKWKESP